MKIALIGASGFVGAAVLQEALSRGHEVTGIVQHPEKLASHAKLHAVKADAYDAAVLAAVLKGHDAVVSAFNPGWDKADILPLFLKGSAAIVAASKQAEVERLLVVGGAGSLYVAPGLQLIDTPDFPAAYKNGAEGARQHLNQLRGEQDLAWTFLSPPALLQPGVRTGHYRVGGEDLLMDGAAPAGISVEDLAVAIVDELEQGKQVRKRFTVAN
ncbi:putative NADH-flavin reductase [Pseudomonas sp. TE3786]